MHLFGQSLTEAGIKLILKSSPGNSAVYPALGPWDDWGRVGHPSVWERESFFPSTTVDSSKCLSKEPGSRVWSNWPDSFSYFWQKYLAISRLVKPISYTVFYSLNFSRNN